MIIVLLGQETPYSTSFLTCFHVASESSTARFGNPSSAMIFLKTLKGAFQIVKQCKIVSHDAKATFQAQKVRYMECIFNIQFLGLLLLKVTGFP